MCLWACECAYKCMHVHAHTCTHVHTHHFKVHLCVEMSPTNDNDLKITASPPIPTSPARVKT